MVTQHIPGQEAWFFLDTIGQASLLPNAACLGPDKIRGSEIENVVLKK